MGQHVRMTRSGKVLRTAGTATAGLGLLALIWAGVTTPAFAGTSGSSNDPLLCVLGICIGGGSGSSSSSPTPSPAASSPAATSAPGLTQPSASASSAPAGNGSGSGTGTGTGSTKTGSGSSTGKVSSASPSASAAAPSASQSSGAGLQALADAASTTPNAAAQPKELPTTSAPTIPVGGTGLALAAGGVALVVASRRRRVSA